MQNTTYQALLRLAEADDDSYGCPGLYVFGCAYADEFLRAYLEDDEITGNEHGHEDWRDADELEDD